MTTRRGFFRLLAGAAIAPIAAKVAAALPGVPVIWGDGIHDDFEGLQALVDGRVVEFADAAMAEGAGWFGSTMRFPRGEFLVSDGLTFDTREAAENEVTYDGVGATLRRVGGKPYAVHAMTRPKQRVQICNFTFDWSEDDTERPPFSSLHYHTFHTFAPDSGNKMIRKGIISRQVA